MTKNKCIIYKLVLNTKYLILEGEKAQEIWNTLEIWFQHILSIGISRILQTTSSKKMLEFKDIINYTSSYQAIFNKITTLIKEDSNLTIKSAEILL